MSAALYVVLRVHGVQMDNIDKFWCALPLFASLISTNRCIFGRIVRLILMRKK